MTLIFGDLTWLRPDRRTLGRSGLVPACVLLLLGLSACASLPSSGPDVSAIEHQSTGPKPAFRIVNLDSSVRADEPPAPVAGRGLGDLAVDSAPSASADAIEVGDVLEVTIYEIGAALFSSGSPAASSPLLNLTGAPSAPAANAQTLPPLIVGPDGSIHVPYVGRIRAAGRSPAEVRNAIEAGLRGKSQNPQVVVSVREDLGNTVVMIGEIKAPGRKPLNYQREHLLDMIAIAGGPSIGIQDAVVRITRHGRSAEMPLDEILSGSSDDLILRPQDRIEIIRHPRTFTAFGASGRVYEIPFQTSNLSLAEALALAGGPSEQQADPTGIFIFRASQDHSQTPILYRLNLRDPSGYFVAQFFQMQDKDIIYIANARANTWAKLLQMVNSVATPVVTSKQLSQ